MLNKIKVWRSANDENHAPYMTSAGVVRLGSRGQSWVLSGSIPGGLRSFFCLLPAGLPENAREIVQEEDESFWAAARGPCKGSCR